MNKDISRRAFLKALGLGGATIAVPSLIGCAGQNGGSKASQGEIPTDKMTMRHNPHTNEDVSILGYGCMRWPTKKEEKDGEEIDVLDQEQINRLVDFAIGHGVNYFDTSPAYCKGQSETATGTALARHDRSKYFVATKLSNFAPETWSHEAGVAMFENSLQQLQTDHIDYYLLHCIGMPTRDLQGHDLNGMQALHARFLDNGMLDWCVEQQRKGRIRNLGWSYHGDIEVVDYLLSLHDAGKYHWDFVQIQLNYVDWKHAREINPGNTNAEYLLGELKKRHIPAVIMEPLLGGRLAKVPEYIAKKYLEREPERSIASWAFRYAGTFPEVLTVLSGMTYMEHLADNLRSFTPLKPLSEEEVQMLLDAADDIVKNPFVACNYCNYCMPCPYGIDIPSIFRHYNRCIDDGNYNHERESAEYRRARRAFLVGYDRSVPRLRQADHCIGCGECKSHCPQRIDIPAELHRIDRYAESLKTDKLQLATKE